MIWLLDLLFGERLARRTSEHLEQLSDSFRRATRGDTQRLLESFRRSTEDKVNLGLTDWDAPIDVPLSEFAKACGLVTGGMGAGKTMLGLLIVKLILALALPQMGLGVLDAKGELFSGALWLLKQRLEELEGTDPQAAEALRQRVVIIDFSSGDPVTPYNLLARGSDIDPEFFALSRADLVMDLLETDGLSLGGVSVLQRLLALLSESSLPVTWVSEVIRDASLRRRLLAQSKSHALIEYFAKHFDSVPKSTLAAIERRIQILTASESVRLALNGLTAPNFKQLQDESRIVLIKCFGASIPRSVARLLHALGISDIRHGVFARQHPDRPYLWLCDESQNFFITSRLRDNMHDLLTMSRSFGSFFFLLTQNMTTAVSDPRLLKVLYTNRNCPVVR